MQVNPVRREEVPQHGAATSPSGSSEITFNASLLREFRAIDFVNRLIDEHRLDPKPIGGTASTASTPTAALASYPPRRSSTPAGTSSRSCTHAGRKAAQDWLNAHYDDLGVRSTLDLRAEFM